MKTHVSSIFKDKNLMKKIQKKLPYLFQIAELESSRSGRVGMEVGSTREKILIALLIHKFGENNVNTEISQALFMPVFWSKTSISFQPYQRWLELWEKDLL